MVAASKPASASRRLRRRSAQLVVGAGHQVGEQLVVGQGRVVERLGRPDELVTDPLAQLLAGGPAEGDEQHVVEQRGTLGDVAGHQRGQGVGLAGAGAGLEHRRGRTGGQRCQQVEGSCGRHTGPRSLTSSGNQSRSASAGIAVSTSRSACSPQTRTWAGVGVLAREPAGPPLLQRLGLRVLAGVRGGRPGERRLERQLQWRPATLVVEVDQVRRAARAVRRRPGRGAAARPACRAAPGRSSARSSCGRGGPPRERAAAPTTRAGACRRAWSSRPTTSRSP